MKLILLLLCQNLWHKKCLNNTRLSVRVWNRWIASLIKGAVKYSETQHSCLKLCVFLDIILVARIAQSLESKLTTKSLWQHLFQLWKSRNWYLTSSERRIVRDLVHHGKVTPRHQILTKTIKLTVFYWLPK